MTDTNTALCRALPQEFHEFLPGGKFSPQYTIDGKVPLVGMDIEDMTLLMDRLGEPKFRAKQLYQWVYARGARCFDDMTNLSKTLRAKLVDNFTLERPRTVEHLKSVDGTEKWLLSYADKNEAETVFIPEKNRGTLCVSSQIGCTMACSFCHTGTQKMVRNLTVGDIVGQIMLARDDLGDWCLGAEEGRKLTNIVMMGMGEPLHNYDNVKKAIKLMMDPAGLGLSRRRITLSTSGIVPNIYKIGEELGVLLAISLHAVRNDLRDELVTANKAYPIEELMECCRSYPSLSNTRRITWEYTMIDGVNDSEEDAHTLVQLIKGIPSKVNLIPFNPWPGTNYKRSTDAQIKKFAKIVLQGGVSAPVRKTRGDDIFAACGQLKSQSKKLSREERQKQKQLQKQMAQTAPNDDHDDDADDDQQVSIVSGAYPQYSLSQPN